MFLSFINVDIVYNKTNVWTFHSKGGPVFKLSPKIRSELCPRRLSLISHFSGLFIIGPEQNTPNYIIKKLTLTPAYKM